MVVVVVAAAVVDVVAAAVVVVVHDFNIFPRILACMSKNSLSERDNMIILICFLFFFFRLQDLKPNNIGVNQNVELKVGQRRGIR